ncbi:MAG: hypothetical protein COW18_12515 [Zetaproteobacteria bacterium CG12_big_fil_rev_8_21_14_0_65_54_13]|nr:MAG: hypothetical protein COX55_01915 [Zetaproteobacteria bacterium CG23_combo_of_CG06-09_8_20_14_all_54_7]PIW44771.1 MAG: hypothetical protein COW18_12515 [Zetaproteobacteria bacterium CG12_big_fil_rev_8_21_14_0_65_54_13]PIX55778.1 MAG: hypothetical protein COZ50_00970 [Zetaproteobacteria bacterium CG_4_10_14_3_um_filter_54_28]PJA30477.1 MAG: hypothetical protein CO188_03540 [Zetaproteobacteria bacterium CG_4_9_14_3_um_filter_54_145]
MKRHIALFVLLMLCAASASAADYPATQGDVIMVEADLGDSTPSLRCFGRTWPVKSMGQQRWRGWIGVDLKKKPGTYDMHWQQGKKLLAQDKLHVSSGTFRISRISVAEKMAVFNQKTLKRIRSEVKALKATYTQGVNANPNVVMHFLPVKGEESTPFGAQRYVNGEPRSPHSGIDIAAPAGTPVRLPLAGSVLLVADMYLNGKTIAIGHGNGLVSVYSHMQSTAVSKGQWVKTGETIGEVGATGRATGPHLHWGVRFYNARVNPASLLEPARL